MHAIIRSALFTALTFGAGGLAAADCSDLDRTKCTIDLPTGIRLAYAEVGPADGPVVILLHGLTDSARSVRGPCRHCLEVDPSLHIFALD